MHNRDCFWKPFGRERVNKFQKLLKSAEKYFYLTFSSFWAKLSWKKSFLIRSEILALLVNTSSANHEYSPSNRETLPLQIQIKLSKKPWSSFLYFFFFLNFSNLHEISNILKKNERYMSNLSEVIDSKTSTYLNV